MSGVESGAATKALARAVVERCRSRKLTLATAESCTGGLVAAALTEIPGASIVIDRGFVTYSNDAKRDLLGVKAQTLLTVGAVSREVAVAMAIGALERAGVDLAVAITGIAGPGGATADKPVGLVHIAACARDGRITHREYRFGALGRATVRARSVIEALKMLLALTKGPRQTKGGTIPKGSDGHRPRPRASRTPRRNAGRPNRTSPPSKPTKPGS